MTEQKEQKHYVTFLPNIFEKSKPTIRFVAQAIDIIVASFPGVSLGPLFYIALETDKTVGLKRRRQNFDAEIELSNEACSEFVWWKYKIKNSFQDLVIPKPDKTIFADACETGWGITDGHNLSGGQ